MFRSRKLINNFIFPNNHQCNYTKTTKTLLVALSLACLEMSFNVKGPGAVILLFRLEYKTSVVCHNVYVVVNFLSQLIFIFTLFLGMIMNANEFETKEI